MLPLVNEEIQFFAHDWGTLLTIDDKSVCVHTLNVLYILITKDEEYKRLGRREQNILKWTALLHDMRKLGPPHFTGRDHCHPFKGGISVLFTFLRLGCLKQDELRAEWITKTYQP